MQDYLLAETNYKKLLTHRYELAVLPWAATEAHNYHLPYGTDVYEANAFAAEAAKRATAAGANVVVLPTIPFGVNTGQHDIYLDINLNPSTQLAILSDIITVLNRQGLYKLLLLNSHGGNDFKAILRELGLRFPAMYLATCSWFAIADKKAFFDHPGDHADEMETSLILHLHPELVLPRTDWGDGAEKKHRIPAFAEGWAWSERRWSQVTADTGVGNPHAASAEKGAAFFDAVCQKMATLMTDLCKLDVSNMYA